MTKITWEFSDGKLANREIQQVENQLNIKFPKKYIEIVSNNDGAYPFPHSFTLGKGEEVFNNLINLSAVADYNIFKTLEAVSDRLIDGIIPFGDDPFGNMICFDYRSGGEPTVVFWDHEIAGGGELEKAITFICNTFTDFLNMLHESEEE